MTIFGVIFFIFFAFGGALGFGFQRELGKPLPGAKARRGRLIEMGDDRLAQILNSSMYKRGYPMVSDSMSAFY